MTSRVSEHTDPELAVEHLPDVAPRAQLDGKEPQIVTRSDDYTVAGHPIDPSTLTFFEQAIATLFAYTASEFIFNLLAASIGGTDSVPLELLLRAIHFVFVAALGLLFNWGMGSGYLQLTVDAEQTSMRLLLKDAQKLFHKAMGMTMAWGLKDVLAEFLITEAFDSELTRIVVANSFFFIASLPSYMLFWTPHMRMLDGEKEHFSLYARTIASSWFPLTAGYGLNAFLRHFVDSVEKDLDVGVKFLIQLIIVAVLTQVAVPLTCIDQEFQKDQRAMWLAGDVTKLGPLSKMPLAYFSQAMKFVCAWATFDAMNYFTFGIYFKCKSPHHCGFETNLAYAIVVSGCFAIYTPICQHAPPPTFVVRRALYYGAGTMAKLLGDAYKHLMIQIMGIIAGWTWTNFISSLIMDALGAGTMKHHGWKEAGFHFFFFVIVHVVGCLIYHQTMENTRDALYVGSTHSSKHRRVLDTSLDNVNDTATAKVHPEPE